MATVGVSFILQPDVHPQSALFTLETLDVERRIVLTYLRYVMEMLRLTVERVQPILIFHKR